MSKTYPWHERVAEIEHQGQTLNVTLRRPESGGDWEIRSIKIPADSSHDSEDISDWLEIIAPDVCRSIQAITEEKFQEEDDTSLTNEEEEEIGEVAGRIYEAAR